MTESGEWTPWQYIKHGLHAAAAGTLDGILRNSKEWSEVRQAAAMARNHAETARRAILDIRERLMALTESQQGAINELSGSLTTLSNNLDTALSSAAEVRDALQEMTEEDGRDQAEVDRLTALVAQMDNDIVNALSPITASVAAMNTKLTTSESDGGSAVTPTA